jgi:hypothetical protein
VWLPAGAWWTDEWVKECTEFPASEHDDQVDVFAYAVRVSVAKWAPPPARPSQPSGSPEIDFMNVPF